MTATRKQHSTKRQTKRKQAAPQPRPAALYLALEPSWNERKLAFATGPLENQFGQPVRWFAYPFGNLNNSRPDRVPLVTAAGYECCLAAMGGFVYPERSYPILPRVPVPDFHRVICTAICTETVAPNAAWFKTNCFWVADRAPPRPSANLAVKTEFLPQV